jgi:hypothetical protein
MTERPQGKGVPEDQMLYAKLLEWGARIGFVVLVAGFLNYMLGLLPHHVPVQRLPELWSLPLADYLARTATPTGWKWLVLLAHGEFPGLVGIAILSGCSIVPLVAVTAVYARRGDRTFAAITILTIAVLLLAASGILTAGH